MSTVSHPLAIRCVQLSAQIGAVKLEKIGMKRRGRALTPMLKEFYGMKRSSSYDEVIARLEADRSETEAQLLKGSDNESAEAN